MSAPVSFGSTYLSDVPGPLYTVPAGQRLLLKQVLLCNQGDSGRTVSLYNVPSGGSEGNSNAVLAGAALGVGTAHLELNMVLEPGDSISASADSPGDVSISGSALLVSGTALPRPSVLHRAMLGTSTAQLYESDGVTTVVKHVSICNITAAPRSFSLYVVPFGETLAGRHAIWLNQQVPSRSTMLVSLSLALAEGDTLHGVADLANSLTAIVSGAAA